MSAFTLYNFYGSNSDDVYKTLWMCLDIIYFIETEKLLLEVL